MNRPIHFEICTDNPEAAAAFYGKVFGWQTQTWDGPQTYWVVTTGGPDEPGINGGIMGTRLGQRVVNTISVESLEATLKAVEDAGGKKIHGPIEIPGVGTHAYCQDPDGVMFGVLQPVMVSS